MIGDSATTLVILTVSRAATNGVAMTCLRQQLLCWSMADRRKPSRTIVFVGDHCRGFSESTRDKSMSAVN
jgi:hypothetical protein